MTATWKATTLPGARISVFVRWAICVKPDAVTSLMLQYYTYAWTSHPNAPRYLCLRDATGELSIKEHKEAFEDPSSQWKPEDELLIGACRIIAPFCNMNHMFVSEHKQSANNEGKVTS